MYLYMQPTKYTHIYNSYIYSILCTTFQALLFNCFSSMICSLHLSKLETKAPFSILCTTFKDLRLSCLCLIMWFHQVWNDISKNVLECRFLILSALSVSDMSTLCRWAFSIFANSCHYLQHHFMYFCKLTSCLAYSW